MPFWNSIRAAASQCSALDFVVSDDFYGMAVQKGNKKLLKELDDALDEMRADGTFQKIYDKWFGDVK